MSDLKRLTECMDDPWLSDALRLAASENPSEETLKATLSAVSAAGASAAAAQIAAAKATLLPAATKTSSSVLLLVAAKAAAVGVVSGLVVAGGAVYILDDSPAPEVTAMHRPAAPRPVRSERLAPKTPTKSAGIPDSMAENPNPQPPTASAHSAARSPLRSERLEREVSALDAVRTELKRGAPLGALRELDGYDRDFPRGELAFEALYLRMEAALARRDVAGARAAAEQILDRASQGPHASRARSVLNELSKLMNEADE